MPQNDPHLHPQPQSSNEAMPTIGLRPQDAQAVDALFEHGYDAKLVDQAGLDTASTRPIQAMGQLLDQWKMPALPSGLAQQTLARIQSAKHQPSGSLPFEQPTPLAPRRRLAFSPGRLTEIGAVAAILLIALSLGIPILANARAKARQALCQTHLGQAGVALNSYTQDFSGVLPRGQTSPNSAWWRVGQPIKKGQPIQSNSAHLYLAARQGYISPDTLACPDNVNAPRHMTADQTDWSNAKSVSYSYQNQYTPKPFRPSENPQVAVLADKNPLFSIRSGQANPQIVYRSDMSPISASRFHRSNGQNILTADGRVNWQSNPIMSKDKDNIWLINQVDQYSGNESPANNNDAFLVP